MNRLIDSYLLDWSNQTTLKPLLLRGARQVGKTFAARQLGKKFQSFIEINLELKPDLRNIFKLDLDPIRIMREISLVTGQEIIPGHTLLFIDEIQAEPKAVTALRYFYEMVPNLHVIGAGSLLDFAIEEVGIPVGRVQFLYMYPMSFAEYLEAIDEKLILNEIAKHEINTPIGEVVHSKILRLISEYLAIGGMPEVVKTWIDHKKPNKCFAIQQSLIDTYKQDFIKYAQKYQIRYLDVLLNSIPLQLGKKFKYSAVPGDFRKRELAPCLDLLATAGIITKVFHTDAQGTPLGSQVDLNEFKVVFLDVALAQAVLDLDLAGWFLNPDQQLINKGEIVEAFIGQEMLAYSNPVQKKPLYYWQRQEKNSQAEVDYVTIINQNITPIEVKSGLGSTLKSMHIFLDSHKNSKFGIRFSTQNYSVYEKIYSYPLYSAFYALSCQKYDVF